MALKGVGVDVLTTVSKLAHMWEGANELPYAGSEQYASEWHVTNLRTERLNPPDSYEENL